MIEKKKEKHQRLTRPIFELIADPKATQTLPSLGSIVDELTHMMGQAHTPIQGISSLIRRDQSMSVRILRLANSAYFSPSQPILNVEEALIYLGLNQVRTSILTARCIEKTCNISDDLISWKEFWIHSVAVGCISGSLSTRLLHIGENAETYYMMGLLHDIGKLVLAYLSPFDFETVLTEAQEAHTEMSQIEFKLLGIDHAGLGAWYLQQQGLASTIYDAVRLHHAWDTESGKNINACVVNLADLYAHSMKLGQSGSEYPDLNIHETSAWETYADACGREPTDPELMGYISSESEKLYILVDQLTS
jgi:HD-like signal output (HDOD) protein